MAVTQALNDKNAELLWVGGEGGMEAALVERANIPFKAIPAAGLHGVGLQRLPGNIMAMMRGISAARQIVDGFKPQAVFYTGGYVAGPVAVAARGLPSLVYVPDIEPGLALKFLGLFATRIAVTSPHSRPFFGKNAPIVVTGYPVRADLADWTKEKARAALSLTGEMPALLVFGGSKGARSINRAMLDSLDALLERVEIIHISGELDWPTVEKAQKALSAPKAARYHAYPYLHAEMGAALAAADLVVARAGASTLGEFPLFGLPAILVPYPHAWRYQKVNAEMLAQAGAAIMMEDERLQAGLYLTVEKLLETPEKLEAMRHAMLALRIPDAAARVARQLQELAGVNYG